MLSLSGPKLCQATYSRAYCHVYWHPLHVRAHPEDCPVYQQCRRIRQCGTEHSCGCDQEAACVEDAVCEHPTEGEDRPHQVCLHHCLKLLVLYRFVVIQHLYRCATLSLQHTGTVHFFSLDMVGEGSRIAPTNGHETLRNRCASEVPESCLEKYGQRISTSRLGDDVLSVAGRDPA